MASYFADQLIEGLTFDDVLLRPGRSEVLPSDVDVVDPADPDHPPQPADHRLRHGHGDGSPHGHRHGPERRPRRDPPQPGAGRPGRAGAPREALRVGHGDEPDHHPPGRDPGRCAGHDEAPRHLRHSGGRARPGRRQGQARRHPDQPRRALRQQPRPAGLRADDQGPPDHGARGREPGRGAPPSAPVPHREAPRRRRPLPLHRPDHREGHREAGRLSQRRQGRAGPPSASPPPPPPASRASSAPSA